MNFLERQIVELGVYNLDIVSGLFKQRAGIAEFQWKMRFAAPEVDAAVEVPKRVNEREPHGGLLFRAETHERGAPQAATHIAAALLRGRSLWQPNLWLP